MAVEVNLLSREALADPYPLYNQLREEDPVHWDSRLNAWLLTRYAEVAALLRDRRFSSRRVVANRADLPPEVQDAIKPLDRSLSLGILFQDPPDHTRLRTLASKAFSPRVIENLRLYVEELVEELLADAPQDGCMDVVEKLAYPLPAMVIAKMLGIPKRDIPLLKQWSDDLALFFARGRATAESAWKAARAVSAMTECLAKVLEEKRSGPGLDFISQLIAAEEAGGVLNDEELLANCIGVLFAGHETTTNLIGNLVLALLLHPDQVEKLREGGSIMASAVEESLRYESPVQLMSRLCSEDLEVDGRAMKRGERVLFILGAVNRDPAHFPDPDRFDVCRTDNRHLAFGAGGHFCLGAPLARAEARAAISGLLRRFPQMGLAQQTLSWRPHMAFRGLTSLQIDTVGSKRDTSHRHQSRAASLRV